jgi:peptidoglycan/xylan/chitin deacetylase (PgdA/CDA1 family)
MESTATARDRPWTPGRRRLRVRLLALALMATLTAGAAAGASLRVAVTVDDLPWSGPPPQGETRLEALRRITAVLRVHGAPATGFVICDHATADDPVLRMWAAWRLQLANHSAAHRDLDRTPVEEWLADVARCDAFLRELGVRSPFFRYPMLHEGAEAERRAAARAGIAELGLRSAPVTVDSSEWLLAAAYRTALARGDAPARSALARTFVDHLGAALGHAEAVARRKLGRTLPHVLLLHANALVADHLDLLLLELERRGVRFVSLEEALADPAYARPDGYLGPRGSRWEATTPTCGRGS